jgi:hypothetical protein
MLASQPFIPGGSPPAQLAFAASAVGLFVYLVGFLASFFLPEPEQGSLQD